MGTLRKEVVFGVTYWELKSHLYQGFGANFTYGTKAWGCDLKSSHWMVFKKGMKIHMMLHQSVIFENLSYSIGQIWRTSQGIMCS
jgi:hypothetical protein